MSEFMVQDLHRQLCEKDKRIAELEQRATDAESVIDSINRLHDGALAEVRAERDELKRENERLKFNNEVLTSRHEDSCWVWQDDEDDHPESLGCPVLVQPSVVRRFVAAEHDNERLQVQLESQAGVLLKTAEKVNEARAENKRLRAEYLELHCAVWACREDEFDESTHHETVEEARRDVLGAHEWRESQKPEAD